MGNHQELIALIAAGKVNVRRLVSRVYPLQRINEAFEAFRKREGGAIRPASACHACGKGA